ncbi:MAG: hypothetical protein JWR10_1701 [Rubritepida sp.]|nr:hypothetical protein [Rubritepida sp.]
MRRYGGIRLRMARSVILFSTPTSASESLYRSAIAIAAGRYRTERWMDRLFRDGRADEIATTSPPTEDCLILHRAPARFNHDTRLADYRFILNARDPRDLICNQYHWQFVHPSMDETPEETEARRRRVAEAGIDHFALAHDNGANFDGFLKVVRRIAPPDRIFIGYAMFCLHFDDAAARMASFLGTSVDALAPKQREALELERVEKLAENDKWIGKSWAGTDTAPGRHKHELKPETVRILTERYAPILQFLRRFDDPRVAHTYD